MCASEITFLSALSTLNLQTVDSHLWYVGSLGKWGCGWGRHFPYITVMVSHRRCSHTLARSHIQKRVGAFFCLDQRNSCQTLRQLYNYSVYVLCSSECDCVIFMISNHLCTPANVIGLNDFPWTPRCSSLYTSHKIIRDEQLLRTNILIWTFDIHHCNFHFKRATAGEAK